MKPHNKSSLPTIVSNTYADGKGIIKFASNVTSIGEDAFNYYNVYPKPRLASIELPYSVVSIGNGAFLYCTNLTSVIIPNGVTIIDAYAFKDCLNLTSINIPNSVVTVGTRAFANCIRATSINIGNGVTTIDTDTFNIGTEMYYFGQLETITVAGTIYNYNGEEWFSVTLGNGTSKELRMWEMGD